jgi:periplasmic divalent cation tolerance protein
MQALLVLTTLADAAQAESLARMLVHARVAACVSILPPCTSVYRWQGAVETAQETMLFIKTTSSRYAALETLVREHHPYDVPELIALPVDRGLPAYLDWLGGETAP